MHKKVTKQLPEGAVLSTQNISTRERLLAVALSHFAEDGFAGTTVDKIVEAACVNKRMVYHYFGSKEDLYCAVLERMYERLTKLDEAFFPLAGDPKEVIRKIVFIYFRFLRDNPDLVQLLLWENLQKGKYIELIAQRSERVSKSPMLGYLDKITRAGIETGQFRRDINIKHLLINLIGLCLIYFSNRYTLSRAVDLDLGGESVLDEAATHAANVVVGGMSVQEPPQTVF